MNEELYNPLDVIFEGIEKKESNAIELFQLKDIDTKIKTEVNIYETLSVTNFWEIGKFLEDKGIKNPYKRYCEEYLKIKVSLNRQSRAEFTTANTPVMPLHKQLSNASNLKNILDSKT